MHGSKFELGEKAKLPLLGCIEGEVMAIYINHKVPLEIEYEVRIKHAGENRFYRLLEKELKKELSFLDRIDCIKRIL